MHIRWSDNTITERLTSNVRHIIPKYYGVYVGRDLYYPSFNGSIKKFGISFGKFAYKNTKEDLDVLYTWNFENE